MHGYEQQLDHYYLEDNTSSPAVTNASTDVLLILIFITRYESHIINIKVGYLLE